MRCITGNMKNCLKRKGGGETCRGVCREVREGGPVRDRASEKHVAVAEEREGNN